MRIHLLFAGLISTFTLLGAGTASAAVDGDLDNSFSGDGKLVTNWTGGGSVPPFMDAVVDANNRLVVASGDGSEIGVARFNPDGTFDTSFGGDGDVQIDSGPTSGGERASAVAIDPATGNILVLGQADNSPTEPNDIVVARLLPSGSPDLTFDGPSGTGNGDFRLDFNDAESPADIIASGDNIVFTASVGSGSTRVAKVVQLTSTGALDTTNFGSPNGFFDFQWAASTDSFANGLARQGDGKLIVSGFPNGAATYGVARINTNGSLDTTFNAAGTPGLLRPPLPSGFNDANALDVVVDANGITVAGNIDSVGAGSEPMLSRITSAGSPDTAFGSSNGFAILPMDAANDESFSGIASLPGGKLFAGGTSGPSFPSIDFDQLAARFTSAGVLDTGFSGDGFLEVDHGASTNGLASPVSGTEVAYLTGQRSGDSTMAIAAVCLTVPPACPSPEIPLVQMVTPASGSNDNNPRVLGTVPAGAAVTSVDIYADPACTPPVLGSGSETLFETTGIPASVPNNSTTTFYANAVGVNGTSPCSTTSVTYTEVTPPAPPVTPSTGATTPTGQRAAALKKCAKIKNKPKKKKCKKRARKLPV